MPPPKRILEIPASYIASANSGRKLLSAEAPNSTTSILDDTSSYTPSFEDWFDPLSISSWEAAEMTVLIKASITLSPNYKKHIYITAITTSLITSASITGLGVALAETGNEIPESWIEMIEGVTKLMAAFVVGKVAINYGKHVFHDIPIVTKSVAGGLATIAVLGPVALNLMRETGEGALSSLSLIIQKQYGAIAFNAIPPALIGGMYLQDRYSCKGVNCGSTGYKYLLLAIFTTLGAGLCSSGLHEIEEIAGETPKVYSLGDSKYLSHKRLPLALLAPFGYRKDPTVLTVIAGSGYFLILMTVHIYNRFIFKPPTQ